MTEFITKDKKVIPIKNSKGNISSNQLKSAPESTSVNKTDADKLMKIKQSTSDKDLIKSIKGEPRTEKTEDAYAEIERRNQLVPHPKHERVGKVFRDDPNAIENMEKKVQNFQNEVDYWKKIIKFPRRDFRGHNQLGDNRWWALTNASTNLRDTKKKLDKLKSDKEKGIKLERVPTFKGGKKRFFFREQS